jgi:large subunit ribosomal protein L15
MALTLNELKPQKGSRKKSKRVGRGLGSKGSYSGRGVKGQRARSGGRAGLKLKGLRRIMLAQPKLRGFKSPHQKPQTVTLQAISEKFKNGEKVSPDTLLKKGLVTDTSAGVKILGTGELKVKVTFEDCRLTQGARAKIGK